jgi:nucleotide-binding universal stress UspA family protein
MRDNEAVARHDPRHILVLCEDSRRGAAGIEQAVVMAERTNARLTIVAVAVLEREDARCCDTRAGYWNQVVQELAAGDLDRARSLVGDCASAEFKVLTGQSVLDAVAREARRSAADVVVVPSGRGIHPWIRARRARRLQRRAPDALVVPSIV